MHKTWLVILCLAMPALAAGQDTVIDRARRASSEGQRDEAIAMLARHLTDSPRDVDARLTYGLMLSWEGRYEEARAEFQRVLAQSPGYTDARVGLMNVEWWSGRAAAAKELVDQILSRDPGNTQARHMLQRIEAGEEPWKVSSSYSFDRFNDKASWHETATALGRQTPRGTVLGRLTTARRFGYTDQLLEFEAYPSIRPGMYAFVGVGTGTERHLFPKFRLSVDVYKSVGRGFEVSGGYRRLQFSGPVSIYVGTVTKYRGTWALIGRTFMVPGEPSNSWSFHGESRRYFGGTSFVGMGYSHGIYRDDPRGWGETDLMHAHTIRSQADVEVTKRHRFQVSASLSRQDRFNRGPLWQLSLSTGTAYRF